MPRNCIFFIILFKICECFAGEQLPNEMHEYALSSISNVYREEFKEAFNDAKRIIKKFPNHPAGYFFYAAVLNSQMEFLQSDRYEIEFYQYCDMAINKGEEILESKHDDMWANFFVAGANGLKGTYESRFERWITAFKHGWRAVVILRDLVEWYTDLNDVYYGIATYNYWRSAKTKMLWWLPGVVDKRDESIAELEQLVKTGVYVKESSTLALSDIYIHRKQYVNALKIINEMLEKYPHNLLCWWGKAKAQFGLKQYDEAEKSFNFILSKISEKDYESKYNTVLCHFFLFKIYYYKKMIAKCIGAYKEMQAVQLSGIDKKRLEDTFKDSEDIYRKVKRIKKKS